MAKQVSVRRKKGDCVHFVAATEPPPEVPSGKRFIGRLTTVRVDALPLSAAVAEQLLRTYADLTAERKSSNSGTLELVPAE